MKAVIDTNVLKVANGDHDGVSEACVDECTRRVRAMQAAGTVVIDDCYRIVREYQRLGLATTPQVAHGRFRLNELIDGVDTWLSRFRDGPLEGVVVRKESADWCEQRAKLVRADFTQAIGEHWRGRQVEWNRLATPSGH